MEEKRRGLFVFVGLIIFTLLLAQTPDTSYWECGTPEDSLLGDKDQVGGWRLPEEGIIRVLVVFVQFEDDTMMPNSRYWPLDSMPYLPDWCRLLVYPDTCSYPNIENLSHTSDSANLSQYFYEMSFGRLHIIGDVYPKIVVPPHTMEWYSNSLNDNDKRIEKVNYDVLTYIDTAVVISESGDTLLKGVDFSLYDNWTLGSYEHINEPDGKVDFIIMIYRWLPWPWWSGLAGLPLDTVIVTYDSLPDGTRVKIVGTGM